MTAIHHTDLFFLFFQTSHLFLNNRFSFRCSSDAWAQVVVVKDTWPPKVAKNVETIAASFVPPKSGSAVRLFNLASDVPTAGLAGSSSGGKKLADGVKYTLGSVVRWVFGVLGAARLSRSFSVCVCAAVCLYSLLESLCVSVSLSLCLSVCLSVCLCLSVYLSVSLSVVARSLAEPKGMCCAHTHMIYIYIYICHVNIPRAVGASRRWQPDVHRCR